MQSAYYQNTGGMVAQFNRLDTISNNLANVNTNGYKKEDVVIGDFLRIYKEKRDELPLENHTKDAAKFYNRTVDRVPHVVESYRTEGLGAMKNTDNPLDFALGREDLYFAVQTPNGIRLTRDGSFTLRDDGTLVNKSGHPVLPANYFQNQQLISFQNDQHMSVDKDGVIYTRDVDDVTAENEQVGSLMVVSYETQKLLEREGNNLYKFDEDKMQLNQNSGAVMQGMIEKSNVNAVREMTGLIETSRLVSMYQKVMDTHMNEINKEAITKLATIKA